MTFPNQDRCTACGKGAAGFVSFRGQRLGVDHAECRNKIARVLPTRSSLHELEVRTVSLADFEIRSKAGKAGTFEGYANKFDVIDDYGTRFTKGAWSRGGLDGEPYPLLHMHDPWEPIGTVRATEDSAGLPVEGVWDNNDVGTRARERAESGSAPELSVGFKTLEKDRGKDATDITSANLREVSQVTARWGSTPGARMVGVRMSSAVGEHRSIEGSYEDLQQELREALQAQFGGGPGNYLWILATFPDKVIYCAGGFDADDNTWQVTYTEDEASETFAFGTPEPVDVTQVVRPRQERTTVTAELEVRRRAEHARLLLTVPIVRRRSALEQRATWDTAYINDLPDSAFLYIEDGGEKDSDGKTKPRSLRHFPVYGSDGKVDLPHLRNALARIPQSTVPDDAKKAAQSKAEKLAKDNGVKTETAAGA